MRDVKEKCDPIRQGKEDGRDQKERGLGTDILIFLLLKKKKRKKGESVSQSVVSMSDSLRSHGP